MKKEPFYQSLTIIQRKDNRTSQIPTQHKDTDQTVASGSPSLWDDNASISLCRRNAFSADFV
jgi:hypothetical protein